MSRVKFQFSNTSGQQLAGLLELPPLDQPVSHYAIFAHCFTCGKDIAAASRISRALAKKGIAVLRFDFTGLGNSDGDFANTNFSSNVQDLLAAANELEIRYQPPSLLIGHSLGGAAVLAAAQQLPSVKAVSTIGAPATADHVQHLFSSTKPTLESEGQAEVKIGFRTFTIKQQLLDDLNRYTNVEYIRQLNRALLIFHSPVDSVVSVDQAAKIYQAAQHPKSFISLDQADHLLSRKEDAEYVAEALSAWASRYLGASQVAEERGFGSAPDVPAGEVLVTELDKRFLRGLFTDSHQLMADEPENYGGSNLGPSPYDLLLMALGACTSMTLRLYASHKQIPLTDVSVRLAHEKVHAEDCEQCEQKEGYIDCMTRHITLKGDLTPEQKVRLLEMADRCPVHRTLENQPVITTKEAI
ncbi:MAG: bifunctional alpha/beta hydrolase/OsmC family protein [Chromatiales bacterium]|nr:bifunctional alpha/beta hydrolase/OsmC family protein [Chromatiales bacterium]